MLQDKLELFDLWVDDYMTKPFEIEELVARLKVLGKRIEKNTFEEKIKIWNITIDTSAKKVYLRQKEIILTYKEYLIVEFLSKFRWQAKQKNEIMEYVWWENEGNLELDSKTLEAHIYAIRKKLWKDFIKTVKLVWYIIE